MLILLTIFLLLFIPFVMLLIHLIRPKFGIQGFLAVIAVLAGWVMVLIARTDISQTISLLSWEPAVFFLNSPTMLIDETSWYFALALISLGLSSIITSIARLGQTHKQDQIRIRNKIDIDEVQDQSDTATSNHQNFPVDEEQPTNNWQSWAGILFLTGLGLVAVSSGNMLTLLLAWAVLDLIELVILLDQGLQSESRERIIVAFSIRMAGIGLVLLAGIIPWSQGLSMNFDAIDQTTSIYLILAAGLRLGVLPLQRPLRFQLPQNSESTTILRLIPAAASYILLVRVAPIGVQGTVSTFLLGFTALAGLYAGFQWMIAQDKFNGQPYWLLGMASLAVASAILNHPSASIAWCIASLLSGGFIYSISLRHKILVPLLFIGFIGFSTLPFSPTWLGTSLYIYTDSPSNIISRPVFYLLSLAFFLIHTLFLAGLIHYIFHDHFSVELKGEIHVERWVWFLYPIGLLFILVTHFLIGIMLYPALWEVPLIGWTMGAVAITLSGVIWYVSRRYLTSVARKDLSSKPSAFGNFLSLEWLYRIFWKFFQTITSIFSLISTILEGEGGILWAFVLFALIFVFLLR